MLPVFLPQIGATQSIVVTGTSGSISLLNVAGTGQTMPDLLLTNVGTQTVFVRVIVYPYPTAAPTVEATTADMPIIANSQLIIRKGVLQGVLAAIASGAGSTLYVTPGQTT